MNSFGGSFFVPEWGLDCQSNNQAEAEETNHEETSERKGVLHRGQFSGERGFFKDFGQFAMPQHVVIRLIVPRKARNQLLPSQGFHMNQAQFNQITFTDADVVNKDGFIPVGENNPHNVRPFLLHDHSFTVAVVLADSQQDALDEAVNAGKMDSFQVSIEDDLADYGPDEEGISRLGNASEPFDIQALDVVELANPPFSFVALFNAHNDSKK